MVCQGFFFVSVLCFAEHTDSFGDGNFLLNFYCSQSSGDEPVAFGGSGTVSEPEKLSEFADLTQRLAILQSKRAEDKARIKELEKFKMQYAQVS